MRTKILSVICLSLLIPPLFLTSLQGEEKKPLRVGISPTDPPIQYMEGNKVAGLEADFAEELGKELGRKVEFVDLKFRKLIPALLADEIDIIMAGMSVTSVRSLQVAFAKPYIKIGQMALVRLEDRNSFLSAIDVITTDKKVGALENTTGEYLVVQEFPNAKKTLFSTTGKGAAALKRKQIDLFISDSPYILWLAMNNEGKFVSLPFYLTEENLAWAVRKSDTGLLDLVNDTLQKWKETGRLDTMFKKWLPKVGS